jgi:DHA2 family multidrug resistance protein
MQALDSSIANVSIPTIAGNLGVSSDQGTWVITSFAVANGASVPLTGWLMDRFGVVRTFVSSVALFTVASFLCGWAWSLPSLVVFRVLQGAVSGPMIPGSLALLIILFGPAKRGTALAIWSMTTMVGPVIGPILGGYISDNYKWPWIFLINVPVGIICVSVCWANLKKHETPLRKAPIDRVGLALLFVWVGALQITLDKGKDLDWFESSTIVTLAVVTGLALISWLIWEFSETQPVVELSLLRRRSFAVGTIALCLGYGLLFGNIVLMPLWLQTNIGYTATWAGLVAAPSGAVAVLISPLVGAMMKRYDARWFATGSLMCFAISYFERSGFTANASFFDYMFPQLAQGLGMSLFFVSFLAITFDGLPPEQVPSASGLTNFLRIIAGGFAVSLTTTFWDRREALHQSRLAEVVNVYAPASQHFFGLLRALGVGNHAAEGAATQMMINQGYLLSSLDLFYLSGWVSVALIPLCWLVRRPSNGDAGAMAT